MSKLRNLIVIFETTMKNAFRVRTNMPGIGSLICEIAVEISEKCEKAKTNVQYPRSKR